MYAQKMLVCYLLVLVNKRERQMRAMCLHTCPYEQHKDTYADVGSMNIPLGHATIIPFPMEGPGSS